MEERKVEERKRFDDYISKKALEGYIVVDKNTEGLVAVLEKQGSKVNHLLHLIITLFSCGVWAIVWIVLIILNRGGQRIRVSIDGSGNLLEEKVNL